MGDEDEGNGGALTGAALSAEARSSEGGCRLSALEQTLCGHVREGDVPGFEIPSRYFHFVRTGDARALAAVMEHNRLDLLSLAMLTAHASQLLEDGSGGGADEQGSAGDGTALRTRRDDRRGARGVSPCRRASRRPIRSPAPKPGAPMPCSRGAQRRFEDAANGWRRILELPRCPPAIVREASEALAVHHEHRLRDLQAARSFARQSLTLQATPSRRQATQHRLARLDRKLGESGPVHAPLF